MKQLLFICFVLVYYMGYSQNNYIVKTDDGRRVLLKADYTWEYIDQQPVTTVDTNKSLPILTPNACNILSNFEEPKLDKKIQAQLKKGRATLAHVKKKVAKDHNCTVDQVILLAISETQRLSKYTFCANGTKVYYKRNGHKILQKGQLF